MKLDTFFEKFDFLADTPDAVAKMRELVLNLAVQGKLVQQNSADEDVQILLVRNDKARRAAAQSDRRADDGNQPLLSADDCWEIPETWSWRALGDLVLFVDYRGKTPAKLSEGIRLLTAKNVRRGEINLSPEEFLSEEEYHDWMTRGFPKAGDVLFTTEAPMGNAAVVALTDRFALAQRVICFQSYGSVGSSFLVLQILSTQFQRILDKNGTGVTAKGIKASKLKQLPIAVPPLAEQERIVAKADELMALCDRLEMQQQERKTRHAALARASQARFDDAPTPANLNFLFHDSYSIDPADLRKSILTLAVQGKLVPQDPNEEPAETHLLPPITSPKDERKTPFELPDSWRWTQLGQVSELINGDRSKNYPNKAEYVQEGVAWINTGHIKSDGTLSTDSMYYITREKFDSLRSGKVRPGDLVYCLRGATLGKTAIITQFEEGAVASSLVIIRLSAAVDPRFAYRFLTSPLGREQIFQFDNGSAQPNLSANNLKKYWLPLPPLAEQRRIVAKVGQLMALVDQLEAQLTHSHDIAEKLMEAVVAELTAQD